MSSLWDCKGSDAIGEKKTMCPMGNMYAHACMIKQTNYVWTFYVIAHPILCRCKGSDTIHEKNVPNGQYACTCIIKQANYVCLYMVASWVEYLVDRGIWWCWRPHFMEPKLLCHHASHPLCLQRAWCHTWKTMHGISIFLQAIRPFISYHCPSARLHYMALHAQEHYNCSWASMCYYTQSVTEEVIWYILKGLVYNIFGVIKQKMPPRFKLIS